jgi:curved DNA-binding protein CbpA
LNYFKGLRMSIYHQILNVPSNAKIEEIKSSYRKLCKIYHPDITNNTSTQKMALINDAYDKLVKKDKKTKEEAKVHDEKGASIVQYKDQAYAFYMQGIKFYNNTDLNMSIGANFYQSKRRSMFASRKSLIEIDQAIMKSLYYFNIICIEYPDSEWYDDSIIKIRRLNLRRKSVNQWLKK